MDKVAKNIEDYFVKSISEGHYSPGERLNAERSLSKELNVNRCSLRTVLKTLEKDGWISIVHGKTTLVNDFLESCNLNAALCRLEIVDDKQSDEIKSSSCEALLDIVEILIRADYEVIKVLEDKYPFPEKIEDFIEFEILFAELISSKTKNKVYKLLLNKLIPLFKISSSDIFKEEVLEARRDRYTQFISIKPYETSGI
jgi:GntR family negative regulator for fad regulon and positive regulator of fabA